MKKLNPKKISVYSVYLISYGAKPQSDDEVVKRRSHLGLFDVSIPPEEIKEAIEENLGLLSGHLGSRAYLGDAPAFAEVKDKRIKEGIVFESIEECLMYLENGLTYQDICDGFRISKETMIEGVDYVEV